MVAEIGLHMPSLLKRVTLKIRITGRRRAALRVRAGILFLRAAAVVMGCSVDLDVEHDA